MHGYLFIYLHIYFLFFSLIIPVIIIINSLDLFEKLILARILQNSKYFSNVTFIVIIINFYYSAILLTRSFHYQLFQPIEQEDNSSKALIYKYLRARCDYTDDTHQVSHAYNVTLMQPWFLHIRMLHWLYIQTYTYFVSTF